MSAYKDFKSRLIEMWPNGLVWNCAVAVMIDHSVTQQETDKKRMFSKEQIIEFIEKFKMICPHGRSQVSTYISRFYPRTSSVLFDGADKNIALKIFMAEKKNVGIVKRKGSITEVRAETKKHDKQIKFIKARSLSKKHDWSTVK